MYRIIVVALPCKKHLETLWYCIAAPVNEWWVFFSSQTHLRTGQDSSCILLVFPCARAPCTPSGGQEGPSLCYISPPRSRTVSGLSCDPFPRQNMEKGTGEKLLVQLGCEMLKQRGGSVRQFCSHQLAASAKPGAGLLQPSSSKPSRALKATPQRQLRRERPPLLVCCFTIWPNSLHLSVRAHLPAAGFPALSAGALLLG